MFPPTGGQLVFIRSFCNYGDSSLGMEAWEQVRSPTHFPCEGEVRQQLPLV